MLAGRIDAREKEGGGGGGGEREGGGRERMQNENVLLPHHSLSVLNHLGAPPSSEKRGRKPQVTSLSCASCGHDKVAR